MTVPSELRQIADAVWELPASWKPGMRVPARFYGTKELVERFDDGVFEQAANVATLPGIQKYSFCMPDGHWGYGFPIGGVAAFDLPRQAEHGRDGNALFARTSGLRDQFPQPGYGLFGLRGRLVQTKAHIAVGRPFGRRCQQAAGPLLSLLVRDG